MTSPKKKVHFGTSLHIIIISIQKSTPKEICGDTQLAIRSIPSDDPDYGQIAQMRAQRLYSFSLRAMKKRREYWRSDAEKLFEAFLRLKTNGLSLTCVKCHTIIPKDSLTVKQSVLFANLPWCPSCRNRLLFDVGTFRNEAKLFSLTII